MNPSSHGDFLGAILFTISSTSSNDTSLINTYDCSSCTNLGTTPVIFEIVIFSIDFRLCKKILEVVEKLCFYILLLSFIASIKGFNGYYYVFVSSLN
jgi:hypothetical protein